MTYLQNITSFEDLKAQFKTLAKQHHPDMGGDAETMKTINNEYDILFPILKTRAKVETNETANSTRSQFYTANGWAGDNYDRNLSLKQIAVFIREYLKEIYPTYKFSVTTEYSSMCQELYVKLMEAPHEVYKTELELNEQEKQKIQEHLHDYSDGINRLTFINELTQAIIKDVDKQVNSYNYDDSDSMIDYFNTNFYYFGCGIGKWNKPFKVVEKTARISNKKQAEPNKDITAIETTSENNYTYDVQQDTDTRDNSVIYVVKIVEKLSKDDYLKANNYMKTIGGYYSRFKHGFIFKTDPTIILNGGENTPPEQQTTQNNRQKLTDKINKQFDSINSKIESLSGNYQTNTYKRMNEQANRESKIDGYTIDLEILNYLLDTLENRDLTTFESALIADSFRTAIHGYMDRHNLFNDKNKPTTAREIEFPQIDKNYPLDGWYNLEAPKRQNRLKRGGIFNTNDLLTAVEAYSNIYKQVHKPYDQKGKQIKELERKFKMQQKGDINFTPSETAKQLIELAHIDENSLVLEPSAGIGNIADRIKEITKNIDVCEYNNGFCELLKLKGYNVVANDFLQYQTDKKYDAIIMNPPFSDEQNHIKHAYNLLKQGGILVSITSPHWTFANDKNSVIFRDWLNNETYYTHDLEGGTFEMTNVSTKILVIEKSEQVNTETA